MQFMTTLLHNPVFLAPALSWAAAQLSKTILYAVLNRDFRAERLFGGGGMPSSHSATVCALVTVCAFIYGPGGFELPMSLFFAFIVMYDAMGVRRETGRQAVVINSMVSILTGKSGDGRSTVSGTDAAGTGDAGTDAAGTDADTAGPEDQLQQLKEFVGHSPLQVAVGAVIGIVIGLLCVTVLQ